MEGENKGSRTDSIGVEWKSVKVGCYILLGNFAFCFVERMVRGALNADSSCTTSL